MRYSYLTTVNFATILEQEHLALGTFRAMMVIEQRQVQDFLSSMARYGRGHPFLHLFRYRKVVPEPTTCHKTGRDHTTKEHLTSEMITFLQILC